MWRRFASVHSDATHPLDHLTMMLLQPRALIFQYRSHDRYVERTADSGRVARMSVHKHQVRRFYDVI